jgi:hypothetical protein
VKSAAENDDIYMERGYPEIRISGDLDSQKGDELLWLK